MKFRLGQINECYGIRSRVYLQGKHCAHSAHDTRRKARVLLPLRTWPNRDRRPGESQVPQSAPNRLIGRSTRTWNKRLKIKF